MSEREDGLVELRGKVKWFSAKRGYGFLAFDESEANDVFLHVTTLRHSGHTNVEAGATISFAAVRGSKGWQVVKVLGVDLTTTDPTAKRAVPPPETIIEGEHLAVVKSYSAERGYGFVTCETADGDIFVHANVMRGCRLHSLKVGQKVMVRLGQGPKGLQAVEISLA